MSDHKRPDGSGEPSPTPSIQVSSNNKNNNNKNNDDENDDDITSASPLASSSNVSALSTPLAAAAAAATARGAVVPTAKDRWKLLRRAILRNNNSNSNQTTKGLYSPQDDQEGSSPMLSLHSFIGYQLVQACPIIATEKPTDETKSSAHHQHHQRTDANVVSDLDLALQRLCQVDWDPMWKIDTSLLLSSDYCSDQNEDAKAVESLVQVLHDTILACQAMQELKGPPPGTMTLTLTFTTLLQSNVEDTRSLSSSPPAPALSSSTPSAPPSISDATVLLQQQQQQQCLEFLAKHQRLMESELSKLGLFDSCSISWARATNDEPSHLGKNETITKLVTLQITTKSDHYRQHQTRDIYKVQCYKPKLEGGGSGSNKGNSTTTMMMMTPGTNPFYHLFIRERMTRQHFSLRELASHTGTTANSSNSNKNTAVDNTGNVCIWDAEKTLTWALAQQLLQNQEVHDTDISTKLLPLIEQPDSSSSSSSASASPCPSVGTVLELGIGMAGLAGLFLSQCGAARRVILTDGHDQCVQNNRINVRLTNACTRSLMQSNHATTMSTSASAFQQNHTPECRVLLWALDDHVPDKDLWDCADLTLVSDCTHFEHYHGHLLWTLLQCTKLQTGRIWMCQPERGKSLKRFRNLIEAVNRYRTQQKSDLKVVSNDGHETTTMPAAPVQVGPLVEIMGEPNFPKLEEMHESFLGKPPLGSLNSSSDNKIGVASALDGGGGVCEGGNPFYRPNVHQPRLLVLKKLRSLTEQDRVNMMEHLRQRCVETRSNDE
ncbi:hypothetical protein ACA910_021872 [Epithemia clementina (nom. ined.)]